jgi:hypothetical protein
LDSLAAKASSQLGTGLEGMEVDALVLQGAPEPLDEDIVHPAAPTILADADIGIAQHACDGGAGKLATLIRFEDFRTAEPGQCLLQRRNAEPSVHRVRHAPGQHLAGCPVHDRHQVEEATTHGDVGHIGAPHVVRSLDRQFAQQLWIDPVLRVRIARARPLVDRRQLHRPPPVHAHRPKAVAKASRASCWEHDKRCTAPHHHQLPDLGVQLFHLALAGSPGNIGLPGEGPCHPSDGLPLPGRDHRVVHAMLGCQLCERQVNRIASSATLALKSAL